MRSERGRMTAGKRRILGFLLFTLIFAGYSWVSNLDTFADAEVLTSEEAPEADAFSIEEAAEIARGYLAEHYEEFTIFLYIPEDPDTAFDVIYDEVPDMVLAHTGVSTEGDYLKHVLQGYGFIMSGGKQVAENYRYKLVFKTGYLMTKEEDEDMTELLDQIYSDLELEGKSEYEKVRIIYDYITSNVANDEEHYGDATYTKQFSPYVALTEKKGVCEAYATLLYRMLMDQGIDSRIIDGWARNGVGHAWNIARVDGNYYYLDSTWDTAGMHRYFLYGSGNDTSHRPDREFTSEDFTSQYPISEITYDQWLKSTYNGWIEEDGSWRYYVDGEMQTGWLTLEDGRYYLDGQGKRLSGIQTIDGDVYCFAKDGALRTGWVQKNGNQYYFDEATGARVAGSKKIDGNWYYFSTKGVMQTGWLTKSGKTYYFGEDGARVTGKQEIDGNTYYFSTKGVMTVGWLTKSGKSYYFNADGTMQFGWKKIDKKWYRFNKKGVMITGWVVDNGKKYYMDEDGVMVVGKTIEIDGTEYTFDRSGVCQNP